MEEENKPKKKKHFLSLAYRVSALPAGMKAQDAMLALLANVERGEPLPDGLDASLFWRNKPGDQAGKSIHPQDERGMYYGEFSEVIAESSRGMFRNFVAKRLRRDLEELRVRTPQEPEPEPATEDEEELIEQQREEQEQKKAALDAKRKKEKGRVIQAIGRAVKTIRIHRKPLTYRQKEKLYTMLRKRLGKKPTVYAVRKHANIVRAEARKLAKRKKKSRRKAGRK